jgi:general L-amino acid transport system permease protein
MKWTPSIEWTRFINNSRLGFLREGSEQFAFLRNPRILGILFQVLLCAMVVALIAAATWNAVDNLARAKIASGFGFWNTTAGFDINQTLIAYSAHTSSFGRAFWVGLLNTLLVSALGIVLATVLGFAVGIGRLSQNWLVARISGFYVETIRNVPLLLQLLFWYEALLKAVPQLRDTQAIAGGFFFSNRGFYIPRPIFEPNMVLVVAAAVLGVIGSMVFAAYARRRREQFGERWPVAGVSVVWCVGFPLLVFGLLRFPVAFEFPEMGRYNVSGGIEILPEFLALLVGLAVYTAAFIAEAVRAGLNAVPKGQSEAASALGLRRRMALRFVVVPQAMRVIVPPLTSQYLNLTKNSSLAVAIGYPDLVQIFTGTILNITGQAVEIVVVTMAVYLSISLATSLAMNWFNARMALPER